MSTSSTASASFSRRFLDGLYLLGGNLAALCVLAILVLMIGASVGRVFEWRVSWVNDIAGNMVAIPIWIPQMSFVIGSAILVIAVLDECVCVFRGGKPSYVARVEERHARGDFSEEM